jgi:hypothetical protein
MDVGFIVVGGISPWGGQVGGAVMISRIGSYRAEASLLGYLCSPDHLDEHLTGVLR